MVPKDAHQTILLNALLVMAQITPRNLALRHTHPESTLNASIRNTDILVFTCSLGIELRAYTMNRCEKIEINLKYRLGRNLSLLKRIRLKAFIINYYSTAQTERLMINTIEAMTLADIVTYHIKIYIK